MQGKNLPGVIDAASGTFAGAAGVFGPGAHEDRQWWEHFKIASFSLNGRIASWWWN